MRESNITRKTGETDITLSLVLDGSGEYEIDTGVGFLDHMLSLFARHGSFDLKAKCVGDTFVDGISSLYASSILTAARSDRAADLKAPSMMWWLFSPANCFRCTEAPSARLNAAMNSLTSSVSKVPTFSVGISSA